MKKTRSSAKEGSGGAPSKLIDARIKKLGDWRGETPARVRALIKQADPDMVEEVKWEKAVERDAGGSGVGSTTGSSAPARPIRRFVKLTFAEGASLKDPSGVFNASLDGNVRRAIDIHEGDIPTFAKEPAEKGCEC